MSLEDGEVYIMSDDGEGEEWVSPTPASTVIVRAVTAETDLDADDLDDVERYVDPGELRDVLSAEEGTVTFQVEGYAVTVDADGDVDVAD